MNRIIALAGVLMAAVCFVGSLGTLYWMWSVQKPVVAKTTQAFLKADEALDFAEKTIDTVKGNLEMSRNHMRLVRTSTGDNNDKATFMERTLARSAAKQVAPNVNDVQHSLERVTEASIVLNSILESLHDVDGVENLDNNQVRDLQTRIDGVTKASLDLSDLLDDPRHGGASGESAADRSERIAASLELVIQLVDSYRKGVIALRKKVQYYQTKSLWWLNNGPFYASIGLGWVALSQIVVIVVAVRCISQRREAVNG